MINISSEAKKKIQQGNTHKEYVIRFPNNDRDDITNVNIVSESVSFTESICSKDKLKFGLCEASMLKFDTINVENIKGRTIDAFLYIDDIEIPLGRFVVSSCERSAKNMQRRKVIAYSLIAQKKWQLSDQIKTILDNFYWKYEDSMMFNTEAVKVMVMPEAYQLSKITEVLDNVSDIATSYISDNEQISVRAYYKTDNDWTYHLPDRAIILKEVYQKEYIKKVRELLEVAKQQRASFNVKYIHNRFRVNNLSYHEEKKNGDTWEGVLSERFEDGVYINFFSDWFNPQDSYFVYPSLFREHYTTDTSTSKKYWKSQVDVYPEIPYRMQLVKITHPDGLNLTEEVLYDTGEYDNCMYEGVTILGVGTMDGNQMFIEPLKQIKQIKSMRVDNNTTGSTTYKNETVYKYDISVLESIDYRQIFESSLELKGKFGKFARDGSFVEFGLENGQLLLPSETLYPSTSLYPMGANGGRFNGSSYFSAWYSDEETKPYRSVTCTYTTLGTDGNEEKAAAEYILIKNVEDIENYQVYDISNNYLIKTNTFQEYEMNEILAEIGESIRSIRYMPAEISMIGLPYLEAGDAISIVTQDGSEFTTYILRRTLNGIQSLKDNFESRG